ncbi:MAG: response regulator transcription factor [Acidobacteria bacterium]|nr:response regulator transcription factor [Acidobacteriota bacterium]
MRTKATAEITERIRIIVLEEYEIFRKGVCLLLSQQKNFEIVGDAGEWDQALTMILREQPDIVIVGLDPEDSEKIDLLPEISNAAETAKILIISKANDREFHSKAVRFGASGVLSEDKSAEMLVKAIACVNEGEVWLDRFTTASLLRELSPRNSTVKQDPDERKIAYLTEREREVIEQVGKGLKNKQIAEALFISEITVHHHLTSIYSKLEVADRFELLIFAYRNRLAEIPR